MKNEKITKCGFVTILGRPNVGKSTLLNTILNEKISIISPVPQTTRHQIRGILNYKNAQIIFIDTPGIHSFRDELALHFNIVAKNSIKDCDLLLYVVDISRKVGEEETKIADFIFQQKIKVITVLNKIDLSINYLNDYIKLCEKFSLLNHNLLYYLPLSAKTGKNISKLLDLILEVLPEQPFFYPLEVKTDFPLKFRIADLIQEKLFLNLKKELPYSVAVEIEDLKEKDNLFYIKAFIYVEKDSQKKIVIGKEGEFLKKIGIESRKDLEILLKKKVFLELLVKKIKDWQTKPRILESLGYNYD